MTDNIQQKVRINFRAEIFLKGKDLEEIKNKWEELGLFSCEALDNGADTIEVVSVEEVPGYKDLTSQFDEI